MYIFLDVYQARVNFWNRELKALRLTLYSELQAPNS